MSNEFLNLSPEEQAAVLRAAREVNNPGDETRLLSTLSMTELYDRVYPPRTPVIDNLLYRGTYVFAGSPKIGKSFFMAQLGYHVASGSPLWEYAVRQGSVLYLALEDDYGRLQGRLSRMFGVEATPHFHLAVQAKSLSDGLNFQLEEFIQLHPDTRLIIVDTLQKVSEVGNENYNYAMDYQRISQMKLFSDTHDVSIIVVHHTRKEKAADVFDEISGTNGLMGAADGSIMLLKKKRIDPVASMLLVGRDQPDQELTLKFNDERCVWELTKAERQFWGSFISEDIARIAAFMKDRVSWEGTASELLEQIPAIRLKANKLKQLLNVSVSVLYNEFGILYIPHQRSNTRKMFALLHRPEEKPSDDVTVGDDKSGTTAENELSSLAELGDDGL